MNKALLGNHHELFSQQIKTLLDLSAPKTQEQEQGHSPVLSCAPQAAKLEGIDFDLVRQKWYPYNQSSDNNVPCSVDAMVLQRHQIYLIEFKSGAAEQLNLVRKAYDSVMILLEKDSMTVADARKSICYIVVSSALQAWSKKDQVITRSIGYKKHPWNDKRITEDYDHWQLRKLEGVIVSKVIVMPPDMFELFVKCEHWI